ncbi:hypothetical protein [Streptomyces sp. HB2AG]|uniref:hypothetical protein n=1 Tax=Streptomyces sp. HB2AG TaxID=2983400 RepID=UPI0022AA8FB4|nr:hypothetical protein [Streptomyces sp. HB2AG]MCZ2525955.1 hypothetical protein [Streptomyces sp. HB2AG]
MAANQAVTAWSRGDVRVVAVRSDTRPAFDPAGPAEAAYFRRTGIFPIMHVVVLRREVCERHRWLARSLDDAFAETKRLCEENFTETAELRRMLPWLLDEADRPRSNPKNSSLRRPSSRPRSGPGPTGPATARATEPPGRP